MPRIVLDQLCRAFHGPGDGIVRAVDHVSLTVEPGELLVLTGPSGCGKTTTLRLIAGVDGPESGSITIDGRVVNGLDARVRDIAMVFQRPALYPHMTAWENIAFGLRIRRCARHEIESRVREVMELLGLGACMDRLPSELSGGQQQRVALGRALVRQPRVLLLDEPLSNLDAPLRNQMRQELARIHERFGLTTIHVTHDQQEALAIGTRIAVMNHGRLVEAAPAPELYSRPRNLFTAGFIGWPPMNLLRGRIVRRAGSLSFESAPAGGAAALRVAVAPNQAPGLESFCERQVVLGIRPEHVTVGHHAAEAESDFQCRVEGLEFTGAEKIVRLDCGGNMLAAKVLPKERFEIGQAIPAAFPASALRFFEPEGAAIPAGD
jgi:ABC-type sugar transport system ATPase subunit